MLGWSLAVTSHAFYNTLATLVQGIGGLSITTLLDWSGWLVMFLFIIWALYREQQWISSHLKEEVNLGLITSAQYRVACSACAQSAVRLAALFNGRFRSTSRFYQLCAELAYKKEQLSTMGDEGGNPKMIEKLRSELARLSIHSLS